MSRPKFTAVLVCDQIRQENNGKLFFIGAYNNSIYARSMPLTLVLSFWFTGRTSDPVFTADIDISLVGKVSDSSIKLVETKAEIETPLEAIESGSDEFFWAFVNVPMMVAERSDLVVKARVEGGKWSTITVKPIIPHAPEAVPA